MKYKSILYLHGLDSYPMPEKVEILRMKGARVSAPHIDYRVNMGKIGLFTELNKIVEEEKVEFVVGSSMGGYMGFYIADYNNLPALLFNPALQGISFDLPVKLKLNDSPKYLILGKNDDVIPPEKTKEFLDRSKFTNYIIREYENGHSIPLELFRAALDYI